MCRDRPTFAFQSQSISDSIAKAKREPGLTPWLTQRLSQQSLLISGREGVERKLVGREDSFLFHKEGSELNPREMSLKPEQGLGSRSSGSRAISTREPSVKASHPRERDRAQSVNLHPWAR